MCFGTDGILRRRPVQPTAPFLRARIRGPCHCTLREDHFPAWTPASHSAGLGEDRSLLPMSISLVSMDAGKGAFSLRCRNDQGEPRLDLPFSSRRNIRAAAPAKYPDSANGSSCSDCRPFPQWELWPSIPPSRGYCVDVHILLQGHSQSLILSRGIFLFSLIFFICLSPLVPFFPVLCDVHPRCFAYGIEL